MLLTGLHTDLECHMQQIHVPYHIVGIFAVVYFRLIVLLFVQHRCAPAPRTRIHVCSKLSHA